MADPTPTTAIDQPVVHSTRSGEDDARETIPEAASSLPAIAGYTLLAELGRGGMGAVYRARQHSLDRIVAVKTLLDPESAGTAVRQRFHREASAMAQLNHPNIVQVYEVGQSGLRPFFAMEYVEGGTLQGFLAGTAQPPEEAARLVETLARALHHAHERSLIHRDLKAANVLLDRRAADSFSGQGSTAILPTVAEAAGGGGPPPVTSLDQFVPKVSDFGLARNLQDVTQTQSGAVLGTPAYMAPEQARGETHRLGPAVDIHGLGLLLYESLTGVSPFFVKGSMAETLKRVEQYHPIAPSQVQPGVPRDLDVICEKCLQKDPGRRYASALELAEELRRFLNHEPILTRPAGRLERAAKWARRHPVQAVLAGAGLLIVLLLAAGFAVVLSMYFQVDEANRLEKQARTDEAVQKERAEDAEHAARVDAARYALRRGNWSDALDNYALAIDHGRPDAAELKIERLRCWFSYRDRPQLKEELDALVETKDLPPRSSALLTLHRGDYLLCEQGRREEAQKLIEEALRDPSLLPAADVEYARGLLHPATEGALGHFRAALAKDAFHHRAHSAVTCELFLTGHFDEGRRAAADMRKIYPTDPVSFFALAWINLLEGNFPASREERRLLGELIGNDERRKQIEEFSASSSSS